MPLTSKNPTRRQRKRTERFLELLLIVPALASLWAPARTSAADYYIDSVAGNDSNNGTTLATAWKSLAKVNATTFQPGDSVLFKSGSAWDGQLWPKGSGAVGHPVRIGKYGQGPKPVVRGNGAAEDAVLLKNQQYWEIEDLEITNSAATPDATRVSRRGVHLVLENFGDARHLVLRHLTIHDVNGRDEPKDNGAIIYSLVGNQKPSRYIDLLIEDNEIYHAGRNGISGWSDSWQRSHWHPSLQVVVRGNRLRDIFGDGIMIIQTDGALLEYNVVAYANQRSEGYNVAIWTWSADNSVIQYNEAYGTKGQRDGEGFDSDWNSRNTVIQYNYSHDNEGGFVLICADGNQNSSDSAGNTGTIVRYNISQNDGYRGISIAGPVQDTLIYNNTLFVGPAEKSDVVLFADWMGWPANTSFFNNIFYVLGEARIGHAVSRAKDGAHTSAAGFGGSRDAKFDSNVYVGQINTVEDAHALAVDPAFVDPGKGADGRDSLRGYALQNNSKARQIGIRIPENGGKDFFDANLQNCTAVDRGAVQSTSCGAP